MADIVDIKNVVKHLVNGSLPDNLCILCLAPLIQDSFESIFTRMCKEDHEYSIADALEVICHVKLGDTENYNVCLNCLQSATSAYNFHLQAKKSFDIVSFYTQELHSYLNNIENIEITKRDVNTLLCIPLPLYQAETKVSEAAILENVKNSPKSKREDKKDDIILIVDKENKSYYQVNKDLLDPLTDDDDEDMVMIINEKKERKKRDPMVYMSCSKCPVKYRFISKLKVHMKNDHNIDIYYCKICKIITENKRDYDAHIQNHTGEHQCTICNMVYKKQDTLLAHMKLHEEKNTMQSSEIICEICGVILPDSSSLSSHMSDKHVKQYTCHYCGRMYKAKGSLRAHLDKHALYMERVRGKSSQKADKPADKRDNNRRAICQTCGRDFVDERSLMWHQRLHNDDRPYTCETCGRSFVSSARRNQHALCAHTRPKRRCPLCPALFHLRSMVNTHVKKVHLKTHKPRSRKVPKSNVYWKTEPVPLQDLSVDVQAHLLEIRAEQCNSSSTYDYLGEPSQSL